jgi:hypothetical protein
VEEGILHSGLKSENLQKKLLKSWKTWPNFRSQQQD